LSLQKLEAESLQKYYTHLGGLTAWNPECYARSYMGSLSECVTKWDISPWSDTFNVGAI